MDVRNFAISLPIHWYRGMPAAILAGMNQIEEIMKMPAGAFNYGDAWLELDKIVDAFSNAEDRIREWTNLLCWAEQQQLSSGHPNFRLGLEHLLGDQNESRGLEHLERAYEQDQHWNPNRARTGQLPIESCASRRIF
jgi:hypothetical protein